FRFHFRGESAMPKSITKKLVQTARARDSAYDIRDTGRKGFILRVRPNGRKAYYIEYGRGRRKLIGSEDKLTLTQARIEFDRLRVEANQGGLKPRRSTTKL